MRLFYDPTIHPNSKSHILSEDESKHIIRVLRMKQGDQIGVLDGNGGSYTCEIVNDNPKKCGLQIIEEIRDPRQNQDIHIAIGPTKQMERLEWFIEKATEIGLTELTLISCTNSERSKIKIDRLMKKAVSAMKQSHRTFLPKINELTNISTFIKDHPNGLIAHCYDEDRHAMEDVFNAKNCPILIGPEGDFTKEEIEFALLNGYKTITLGKNRLRTETAALYACMRAKLIIE
ncbi:MAG: 16S rRNA (uracil(1498)-N(3))-methyltransferase [Crocinitomicaceae bacterium]|nr:16S rRNA (uracil(1498)-N(3))-methyltransferase [Crocinitomicaceae bacterium]